MITAQIIQDSICHNGKRITTFELEYPRFIHSELMTHRALSKNSASSRAIPIKTMLSLVWNNMATPIHWGKQQAGMQAQHELTGNRLALSKALWTISGKIACVFAWLMYKCGLAKQVVNRIVEPWSHIKIVLTGTDFDNFFHLRNHPDAQPEIHGLASKMWKCYKNNKPRYLKEGEWHLPYVEHDFDNDGQIKYFLNLTYEEVQAAQPDERGLYRQYLTLEEAKQLSSSLCAQVSYRKADTSLAKALKIYQRLVESKPVHASPFEHQATPLPQATDRSGNFSGWRQMRQDIADNVCHQYKEYSIFDHFKVIDVDLTARPERRLEK